MVLKRFTIKKTVLVALFAVFFLIPLFFLTFDADRRVERVLFFPDEEGHTMHGELRRLPVRSDLEGNIELYVDELILGPVNIDLYRLVPEVVRLESILVDGSILYLGFSENLITAAETVPAGFSEIIRNVESAVMFNFPEIKEVKTAVGGEPIDTNEGNVEKK